mmetsp:Transcript_69802/g.166583  ORF Transcript_69802/g.166583 Transcript_69802/m.166583 type:complete len:90 (-) Transcript_69802:127-396(-)
MSMKRTWRMLLAQWTKTVRRFCPLFKDLTVVALSVCNDAFSDGVPFIWSWYGLATVSWSTYGSLVQCQVSVLKLSWPKAVWANLPCTKQ